MLRHITDREIADILIWVDVATWITTAAFAALAATIEPGAINAAIGSGICAIWLTCVTVACVIQARKDD